MPCTDKIFRGALVASLLWVSSPLTPPAAFAEKHDTGGMMGQIEVAYTEIVKAIMVSSVQDEDDVSFDQADQWAEEIVKISNLLPKLKEFKTDESALAFFRRMAKDSRNIQNLAKTKRFEGMTAALFRLQATCIGCHKKHRN